MNRTFVLVLTVATLWLGGGVSTASACVRAAEADTLIGLSRDGAYALYGRAAQGDVFSHAEIHPTRAEGWLYWIWPKGINEAEVGVTGDLEVRKLPQTRCDPWANGTVVESSPGVLTLKRLLSFKTVAALGIMAIEDVKWLDGVTARVKFTPDKRHADHLLVIDHPDDQFDAELVVPVWCVGSCLRDEDYKHWAAKLVSVARVGERTVYRLRMKGVCNGVAARDPWMERLIALPDPAAKKPQRRTCKGSGTGPIRSERAQDSSRME